MTFGCAVLVNWKYMYDFWTLRHDVMFSATLSGYNLAVLRPCGIYTELAVTPISPTVDKLYMSSVSSCVV